jgi:SP family general alpha glucoside:H+ symporter-like MFS transporter
MSTEYVEDTKKLTDVTIGLAKKSSSDSLNGAMDEYISKFLDMSNEAKDNDHKDKVMPLKEGITTFPKAVMWSLILSSALIMEGYDTNLLTSMFGYPAFTKKYGEYYLDIGEYQIPARWQTGLSMGYQCGQLVGLFIAGYTADIVGYRKTLMTALITSVGLIFLQFFSPNIEVLLLSYVLLGINWGSYQTITVTYAAEVAPSCLRVYLTTYVNLCWVFGQLISSGVLKAVSTSTNANAYRIPFAVQWIWPIPIFIGVFLAPESPWFLAKKERNTEAKHAIKRLLTENKTLPNKDVLAGAMLTKIQMALKEESSHTTGAIGDCFKGTDFRRTRIAALTWLFQSITGSSLMGYSTYFYLQAGMSVSFSFSFSIIQYCIGIIGTTGSWFVSRKVGRFKMYFGGLCVQTIILFVVGILGCLNGSGTSWAIGSMLIIYTFVYDLTVGPMCYCIVAEIPSAKLRARTVMLARNLYNVGGIIIGVMMPYMLNPTAWNWKAKTGFFFGGISIIGATWVYFELPETKGRTFAELDALFQQGVPSRKFSSTEVDVFDAGKMMEKFGEDGIRDFVKKDEQGSIEVIETQEKYA